MLFTSLKSSWVIAFYCIWQSWATERAMSGRELFEVNSCCPQNVLHVARSTVSIVTDRLMCLPWYIQIWFLRCSTTNPRHRSVLSYLFPVKQCLGSHSFGIFVGATKCTLHAKFFRKGSVVRVKETRACFNQTVVREPYFQYLVFGSLALGPGLVITLQCNGTDRMYVCSYAAAEWSDWEWDGD